MITVQQKIKRIADIFKSEGVSYNFNDWQRANVDLDNYEFPCIIYSLPPSGSVNRRGMDFTDNPNTLISFVDKIEFDSKSEAHDCTVERMLKLAYKFFYSLEQSGMFDPLIYPLQYTTHYDQLDVNVTGISFEVQLQEVEGWCERDIQKEIDNLNCDPCLEV